MAYWASDMVALNILETASSIVAVGLSWREAIPIMFVGTFCVSIPMVLNGAIGSRLHVPFSVIAASSFGFYFRYFATIIRAILAMFWLGVQTANGANCISVMLRAWAPSYANIPNHLPASAGITTEGMLSYFLFWIIQFPFLLIHPTKLRWVFVVKLICAPIAAIATMAWSLKQADGGGDLWKLSATVSGSEYAWTWLSCFSSIIGSWSTLAVNIPDFTRYAKTSKSQLIQLPFIPLIFTVCGTVGLVTTSATKVLTGTYLWNPLDIIALWLDNGAGGRCAAFFAALSWCIAQIGTNISSNSISAANDLTVLFPRWINIRRGSIISALISGWIFVPWKILASATTLLTFLSGCAVFLGPIAGIMACDYWLVKKKHIDIPALYDPRGRYTYVRGVNWRAAVAFFVSFSPCLPGLAQSISPDSVGVNEGIKHLYAFSWLFGICISVFLYTSLNYMFPAKATLVLATVWGPNDSVLEAYAAGESIRLENGEICESELQSLEQVAKGSPVTETKNDS
jgi:NCS1 family nucleobase:cation symporter-1